MPQTTPLFTDHSRRWRENRYVYPVISRRSRGLSIGVNLSPTKACTFDCVYCSVDRTVPGSGPGADLPTLERELGELLSQATSGALYADGPLAQTPPELRRLNDVAFSGDGEPTAAPEFPAALRLAAEALERRGLDARLVVITNATLLDKPRVAEALAAVPAGRLEIWAKLDAGSPGHYARVDRSRVPFERILANLLAAGRARPLVLQSMFMRLQGQPPTDAEVDAWVARVKELAEAGCRIERVQVYTAARRTAEAYVAPLEDEALDAIAARVRELGLAADTYYGPR